MKENLEKCFSYFSGEIQKLIAQIEAERMQNGGSTYESASRLMELGVEEDSDTLIGIAYFHLAECCLWQREADTASLNLTNCIKYLQGNGPYYYIARAYNLLGALMLSRDNVIMAIETYENALKCCIDYDMTYHAAIVLGNIGVCYQHIYQVGEALEYYNLAMEQYERAGESGEQGASESNRLICAANKTMLLILLNRVDEAELLIREIQTYRSSEQAEVIEFDVVLAVYYWKKDRKEEVEELIPRIKRILTHIQILFSYDSVYLFLDMLVKMKRYQDLRESLEILKHVLESLKNSGFFLHVMKLRLLYGTEEMQMQDLQKGILEFFCFFEEIQKQQGAANMKELSMRRQLVKIQEREYELKALNQQLLQTSRHDDLTGLPNRGYLNQYAENAFEKAFLQKKTFGVCFCDIDCFKQLNDGYGHLQGDACLVKIADVFREETIENMFCARYGGDEFIIIFYNKTTAEIEEVLQSIRQKIAKLHIENRDSAVNKEMTVSIGGFNRIPVKENRLWDFYSVADNILYEVKRNGRNHYQIEETVKK